MKTYEPLGGELIKTAVKKIVDMANKSNEIVTADFNDIILVANPGDDPAILEKNFHDEIHTQHQAYLNSDAYKIACKKVEEEKKQQELELKAELSFAPEKMTLRNEVDWKKCVESNTDPYGSCVIRYAEIWARLMEGRIAKGILCGNAVKIEDCAEVTGHIADIEGITGFMYGCAVSILSKVWIHGEQLRRWHNLSMQLGIEGEKANESGGVLNPALLCIESK